MMEIDGHTRNVDQTLGERTEILPMFRVTRENLLSSEFNLPGGQMN